ncbi:MAG: hypothetical protein ACXAC8_05060 [Candidatus Hodarchaeales archaeon]|jgi:hypothetical protein
MSIIFIFGLSAITVIRIIGLGVAFDFYRYKKERRFIAQMLGWGIGILAGIFHFISYLSENQIIIEYFFLFFGIFTGISSLFIAVSIVLYFRSITINQIRILSSILAITPLLFYFGFGLEAAVNISLIFSYIIVGSLYFVGILEIKAFREQVGKSIGWFYGLIAVGILHFIVFLLFNFQGINLGTYTAHIENDTVLMINNSISIGILVITAILLIHLENSRSYHFNYELKDKFSHDLGNIMQVIVSLMPLLQNNESIGEERDSAMELLNQKCEEASDLITEIRSL